MRSYKDTTPGDIFELWQVLPDGSQTRICVRTVTGEACDLATGELIHIHPTKRINPAYGFPSGRVGLINGRPCFASAVTPGRMRCEYFVIIGSTIEPESLIEWPHHGAKYGTLPREVDIILRGMVLLIRKAAKLLQAQAETLETLLEGDIMTGAENSMPTGIKNPEFDRGTGEA